MSELPKAAEGHRQTGYRTIRAVLRLAIRWIATLVVVFYASCTIALIVLTWVYPPTTGVQVQRRLEAWFNEEDYTKRQRFLSIQDIDSDLKWAVIAAEDGRFYEHAGVDWKAVEKAVEERQTRGRVRGGSTITQQVAKNLFLTTHSTYLRKALELPLAYLTDLILKKDRILELYLNVVEWGPGIYGAEAAAYHHYGRSAGRLSRNQAARLAACLPDPRRRRPQRMDRLSRSIMTRMSQLGH
jgi:monofunctional biosynthetic peptidoglycan transglycosylase